MKKNKKLLIILMTIFTLTFTSIVSTTESFASSYYKNTDKAITYVNSQLKSHEEDFTIKFCSSYSPKTRITYIRNHSFMNDEYFEASIYNGYDAYYSYYKYNKKYYISVEFIMGYKTTLEEEYILDTKVDEVLQSLDLEDKSREEKIRAIYDYICLNVDYDFSEDNSELKYTAYAALINGEAVCQGYASLFYKMCKKVNIPVKIIFGTSNGENHAWNMVKIGTKWYNTDVTWDAVHDTHSYYLKGSQEFLDHRADYEYRTSKFKKKYPISRTSYL